MNSLLYALSISKTSHLKYKSDHKKPQIGVNRAFGGKIMAEAVLAATSAVDDPRFHLTGFNCQFLSLIPLNVDILYTVEFQWKGRTTIITSITVTVDSKLKSIIRCAFRLNDSGCNSINNTSLQVSVTQPQHLKTVHEIIMPRIDSLSPKAAIRVKKILYNLDMCVFKYANPSDVIGLLERKLPIQSGRDIWVKPKQAGMPMKPFIAYISDTNLLESALDTIDMSQYHLDLLVTTSHKVTYFCDEMTDVVDYLWFHIEPVFISEKRAYCQGSIRDQNGVLLASCVQEGYLSMSQL